MSPAMASLDQALEKYLPQVRFSPTDGPQPRAADRPWVVLLTGSTGSLGAHILAALHQQAPEQVRKVYCLNRPPTGSGARGRRNVPRPEDARFVFLEAKFEAPLLGLDHEDYQRLRDEVTVVLHSAWTVRFFLALASFRPQLEGLRNMLYFAHQSHHRCTVLFISSLGFLYGSEQRPIGEVLYPEHVMRTKDGYPQSKYVAERMLGEYTRATGLSAVVLRVGQIAGPVYQSGVWPRQEWLPTLLDASKHLDALPWTLGKHQNVDWIPVDIMSRIVLEITAHVTATAACGPDSRPGGADSRPGGAAQELPIFNVANPRTVSFGDLLPHLRPVTDRALAAETWVERLRKSAACQVTPGRDLLGFYEHVLASDAPPVETCTRNLQLASPTARALKPVGKSWIDTWLVQWGFRSSSHM